MWCLYIGSFLFFCYWTGERFDNTFATLVGNPFLPLISSTTNISFKSSSALIVFAILPVLAIIIYGISRQWSPIIRDFSIYWKYGVSKYGDSLLSMQGNFKQKKEYEYFLACLFKGDDTTLSSFSFHAIGKGIVHRLFNGGSEAIIALIEDNQRLVIRKFAVGHAAKKLKSQADWLKHYHNSGLPLVEIIGELKGPDYYRYDMPFIVPSNDLYDVIHTAPIEKGISLLHSIFDRLQWFHKTQEGNLADAGLVEMYLKEKVIKNVEYIFKEIEKSLPGHEYSINGQSYCLKDWECLRDIDWLMEQVHDFRTAIIHGDTTIENIIVLPGTENNIYFIDPNPDNIFNSPLIDYAKLMQSLHLGYEGLHRGVECSFFGKEIMINIVRSHAYSILHNRFEKLITDSHGAGILREVYFHELINYIRLTPYKLKENPKTGLAFFCCTSILLARYLMLKDG
jgi:hypothetical protein